MRKTARVEERLGRVPWARESPRLRCLGYDFSYRTNDPDLDEHLGAIFAGFVDRGAARHRYDILVDEVRTRVWHDGTRLLATRAPSIALDVLLWHVNHSVIESTTAQLLVHAAAVTIGGGAVVLAAPQESGKSTLAGALVERGAGYLTDEAAPFDPDTAQVLPYPRALTIDRGSFEVLASLRPRPDPGRARFGGQQWHVPPTDIRFDAVAPPSEVRAVISPRFAADAATKLLPMSRAEAITVLAENAFNFGRFGAHGLELLARIVRGATCHRLVYSDLTTACDLVESAGSHAPAPAAVR